jgi:hypothetical protein
MLRDTLGRRNAAPGAEHQARLDFLLDLRDDAIRGSIDRIADPA